MQNCGRGGEVQPPQAVKGTGGDFSPNAYGGTDVCVHCSGTTTAIQSETFSWRAGNTVIVTFNDLSGVTGQGARSTDGGATFTRIPSSAFTGLGTNFGDPMVVFDAMEWLSLLLLPLPQP